MEEEYPQAGYAHGKLSQTVDVLATEPGEIRERLLRATDYLWAVSPDMLPPHISIHLVWVREQLTRFEPILSNEGSVRATLRRIHRKTGVEIAKRIVLIEALLETYIK